MEVNRACIGSTNFLIFDCYNIRICNTARKGKVKAEPSKKIWETNRGQIKEQDVPLTWDSPQAWPC